MAVVSRLLSFLCCLLVIINFITQACAKPVVQQFCNPNNGGGNYTTNSAYHTNLNNLLSTLTSNTQINYGFYNLSYGENSDKVYAIGLCRGDIKADKCRSCLDNAKANLTQYCPNQKEAIGWYDDETCMLRYSNRSIFGLVETGPAYYVWSMNNATDADEFNKDVKSLLESLKSRAASSGDSRRKYATAMARGPNNQNIYGLVQCTPDLSGPDCATCLNQSIEVIPSCCNNRIGARVVRPSCNMRYEISLFYDAATDTPSPSPSSPAGPPPPPTSDAPLPPPPSTDADAVPPPPQPSPSPTSQGISNKSRTAIGFFLLFLCSFLYTS